MKSQNFGPSLMTQEHIIGSVIVSVDIVENMTSFLFPSSSSWFWKRLGPF